MKMRSFIVSFLILLVCAGSATAEGKTVLNLISEKETNEFLPAKVQESYLKVTSDLNYIVGSYWHMRGTNSVDGSDANMNVPFIFHINEDGKVFITSSPFKEIPPDDERPEGRYETFTMHMESDKKFFLLKNYGMKDMGKSMYQSMLDLKMTKYVLGNVEYKTEKFFSSIDSLVNSDQRKVLSVLRDNVGGASGFDEKMKRNSDVLTKGLMLYVPLGFLVLGFAIQLAIMMYGHLTSNRSVAVSAAVIRFVVYMFVIMFYRSWISFTIDFFSVISNAVVPVEAEMYVTSNLLSTAAISDMNTGLFAGYVASFARYLGYLAVQILMIMRDVFLSISVIFGPLIIAISFPSTGEGNKEIDFGRNMLSGWIEGFVRLMLWAPIASACIVILGMTTILSAIGAQSALAVIVMALSMMFACTKVPNLAEKMSGQGLASVYALLGGTVMSSAGKAVTGTISVTGSAAAGIGGKILSPGGDGKTGNLTSRGLALSAMGGLRGIAKNLSGSASTALSSAVEKAKENAESPETPSVDIRRGPAT